MIEAIFARPVVADTAVRDQPFVAHLAERVEVIAAVVGSDAGVGHPIGPRAGALRAGELDMAGGQVVADESRGVHGRAGRAPTVHPCADRLTALVAELVRRILWLGLDDSVLCEDLDEIAGLQAVTRRGV